MRRRPTCKEGFVSFAEAKAVVKEANINTSIGFKIWAFSNARPTNIPVAPESVYSEEWKGWADFLGKERVTRGTKRRPPKDMVFMSFEEARSMIQKEQLKSVNQFKVWAASSKRPMTFPSNPDLFYKEQWLGYRDFLGNAAVEFLSFEECRKIVLNLNFRTENEFRTWAKSADRPLNFPSNPDKFYKEKWESWRQFLQSGV